MSKVTKKLAVRLLSSLLAFSVSASCAFTAFAGSKQAAQTQTYGISATDITGDVTQKLADEALRYYETDEQSERFNDNDMVWVIVRMRGDSIVDRFKTEGDYASVSEYAQSEKATVYAGDMVDAQDAFVQKMASKMIIEKKYNYTTLFNGFAARIRYGDIELLENCHEVTSVIISEKYNKPFSEVTENEVNVYSTGIYDSSDIDFKGEGTVVAVLDTGLDYNHTAFSQMPQDNSRLAINKDTVISKLTQSAAYSLSAGKASGAFTLKAEDVYLNDKVPFAYDYADKDADVYPINMHGTHVAGIIAGKDHEITGVATEAQLAIFKVFSNKDEGAQTIDILAALSDCVLLGVDAINMSLGTSCGFARETDEVEVNEIYDAIRDSGTCLIVAASNDYSSAFGSEYGDTNLTKNPDSGTVGSPASYEASMAVASIAGVKTKYLLANDKEIIYFEDSSKTNGDKNDFVTEILKGEQKKTFEYVTVPGVGMAGDYIGLDLNGKIALVSRGNSTFEEKVQQAYDHGAIACIIFNHKSGTIRMTVGNNAKIPSCSIDMDMGNLLKSQATGKLEFSTEYQAGPFMSDFSSWGVLPNLELSPDISAHGGEIYSAAPGGGYDRISGTSMACPNMAGATVLVREYVKQKFSDLSAVELKNLTYQMMMSTTTIAMNKDGNPYSPRKQGAGLADIAKAIDTPAYLWVEGENKTKLSIGDDPNKTGVYELKFNLTNVSSQALAYRVNPIVMTESVSSDGKTVAERAHVFEGYGYSVTVDGQSASSGRIFVEGYDTVEVKVTVTLTADQKKYIDDNFENGMFVEGFIQMLSANADNINLNIPWLGFYGNWMQAPMYDYTAYEIGDSLLDSSVLEKDKLKPMAYGTIPAGGYILNAGEDPAMWGLGEYAYLYSENKYSAPVVQEDKASLSADTGATFELSAVFAGLLRGAKTTFVTVEDVVTGDVVYEGTHHETSKSYSSGARRPGYLKIKKSVSELGLENNRKYRIKLESYLDYGTIEQQKGVVQNNTFESTFYIDSEKPVLRDDLTELRIVKDSSGRNRYYLDVYLYDNHYLQCLVAATYRSISGGSLVDDVRFDRYPIPLNSARGTTNKITLDLTSHWNDISDRDEQLYFEVYDYAKNRSSFQVKLPKLTAEETTFAREKDTKYYLSKGETVDIRKFTESNLFEEWTDDITWTSSKENVATVENGVVTALASGETKIVARKPGVNTPFTVTVNVAEQRTIAINKNATADMNDYLTTYPFYARKTSVKWSSSDSSTVTINAETGEIVGLKEGTATITATTENGNEKSVVVKVNARGNSTVTISAIRLNESFMEMETGETRELYAEIHPFTIDPNSINLQWNVSGALKIIEDPNDPLHVTVRALSSGSTAASGMVTVKEVASGGSFISASCNVSVKAEFFLEGRFLRGYVGRGDENGVVDIPEELGILYFYDQAIINNPYVKKIIIPEGVEQLYQASIYGCDNLEEIVFPKSMKQIGRFGCAWNPKLSKVNLENVDVIADLAFVYDGALEEVDLSNVNFIGYAAFLNCYGLRSIDIGNVGQMGEMAFANCTGLTEIQMTEKTKLGQTAFALCTGLTTLQIPTTYVGKAAFMGCTGLRNVIFTNNVTKIDQQAFADCISLTSINFMKTVQIIELGAFMGCTGITELVLPDGIEVIEQAAFANLTELTSVRIPANAELKNLSYAAFGACNKLVEFTVDPGNKYLASNDGILYDVSFTEIILVPQAKKLDDFVGLPATVRTIGKYAFSYRNDMTAIDLKNVEYIEEGAFYGNSYLKKMYSTTGYKVKVIDDVAFYGCNRLKIELSETLEFIGESAFAAASTGASIYTLTLPASLKTVEFNAFRACTAIAKVVLPETFTDISDQMFTQCTNLAEINFHSNLKSIGEAAFAETALKTIVLPDSLGDNVGKYAFMACNSLTSVTLPNTMTVVPEGIFAAGKSSDGVTTLYPKMESIVIPDSVIEIGAHAFNECKNLSSVTMNNVKTVGERAFIRTKLSVVDYASIVNVGTGAFNSIIQLTSVNLPNAEIFGDYVFTNSTNIAEINIPKAKKVGYNFLIRTKITTLDLPALEETGSAAFAYNANLTSVTLSNNMKHIEKNTFRECALTSMFIPASVTKIGDYAFAYNPALTEVTVDPMNKVFFNGQTADQQSDGVVYRRLGNREYLNESGKWVVAETYEIVCYPNGKTDTKYEATIGTVRITAGAFVGNQKLEHIVMPSSMQSIGDGAFYAVSKLKTVEIRAKEAPALESSFISGDNLAYANFVGDVEMGETFALTLIRPENGSRYDNYIWEMFFLTIEKAKIN